MPVDIRGLINKAQSSKVKAWLKVLGPPFISLTIILCVLGGAIAFYHGYFSLPLFLAVLFALSCIHFGCSALNDYFDYLSGSDNINQQVTPYSGGSRVIQENMIKPRTLFTVGISLMIIGGLIGLVLAILKGVPVLILGIIGMFLAIGYVEPHINLSARGLGELAVFLGFGPLILTGVHFVQTDKFDSISLFVGIIMGILASSVLWINEIPDFEADRKVGKRNLVVRLGKEKAVRIYASLIVLAFIGASIGILLKILPLGCIFVFLSLPIAYKAIHIALTNYNDIQKLLPANALTIALVLVFGLFLSISFIFKALT